eukprot:5674364-Prymnesium_polylepis.1
MCTPYLVGVFARWGALSLVLQRPTPRASGASCVAGRGTHIVTTRKTQTTGSHGSLRTAPT